MCGVWVDVLYVCAWGYACMGVDVRGGGCAWGVDVRGGWMCVGGGCDGCEDEDERSGGV